MIKDKMSECIFCIKLEKGLEISEIMHIPDTPYSLYPIPSFYTGGERLFLENHVSTFLVSLVQSSVRNRWRKCSGFTQAGSCVVGRRFKWVHS